MPLPPFLTQIDSEGRRRRGCKFNTPKVRPTLKGRAQRKEMSSGRKRMQGNVEEERLDERK